jgi:hypothetical protein
MRNFSYLALLASVILALPAYAQDQAPPPPPPPMSNSGGPSAVELIKLCLEGAAGGTVTNPICTGYLAGFIGALRIAQTVSDDFPICLPEQGLTNLQVVNDVSGYLELNQGQLQRSARSVFFLVMTNKYPCEAP